MKIKRLGASVVLDIETMSGTKGGSFAKHCRSYFKQMQIDAENALKFDAVVYLKEKKRLSR
jgi:hypothetical protein